MTCLEHFVENGLCLIDKVSPEEWRSRMKRDPNLKYIRLTIDELWEIVQYVRYSYLPCRIEEEREKFYDFDSLF